VADLTHPRILGQAFAGHALYPREYYHGFVYAQDSRGISVFEPVGLRPSITEPVIGATPTVPVNYPNPFNSATTIRFILEETGPVQLSVYDILGRHVRTLVSQGLPAGEHLTTWDGTDENGRAVGSGVYFYRLSLGDVARTGKMLLLK